MQWRGRRSSSNISNSGSGGRRGGGLAISGGGLIIGLIVLLLTGDPLTALQAGFNASGGSSSPSVQMQSSELSGAIKERYDYSAVVLADAEDTWTTILSEASVRYRPAKLQTYSGMIQTGCGLGQSGMGPFYCGADETVYMDLSFYDELISTYGAKQGDFILSYVISHEIGHHVQKVTGVLSKVNERRASAAQNEANALTVRLELQADYLAGVVARYQKERGYLEAGDIEEAISAAWSIGDDTLQRRSGRYVSPESFTHGSSEQRTRWYKKGYEAGDLSEWNTFDTQKYPSVKDL